MTETGEWLSSNFDNDGAATRHEASSLCCCPLLSGCERSAVHGVTGWLETIAAR